MEQKGVLALLKEKEKIVALEKQTSEMRSLVLHKEALLAKQEQSFNDVLNVCARYSKNDKVLMQKLRELKAKQMEGTN